VADQQGLWQMPDDQMRYDLLAQQALRGVVRAALRNVERSGLPGEHHFYIAFDTTHPGTKISDRLKRKHPEEMTIVLQHQFWGLSVTEDGFKVELSFDNIPEKMEIPFVAVKGFFDPYVQFGLQFEMDEANQNTAEDDEKSASVAEKKPDTKSNDDKEDSAQEGEMSKLDDDQVSQPPIAANDPVSENDPPAEDQSDDSEEESGEKVVSLDAFRKK
jgi:hypothetical protein